MSLQGRIDELAHKHRELDKKIQHVQKLASTDTLTLTELKRRKLRLKEELARVSQPEG